MTERPEFRFNVYNDTDTAYGIGTILPFNRIDFDTVDGYDIENRKYTFQKSGTYLIGLSWQKTGNVGGVFMRLVKSGTTAVLTIAYNQQLPSTLRTTINECFMYQFNVGDVIYPEVNYGAPRMNEVAPTGDNIHNSFWGIRLDYDVSIS